MSQLVVKDHVPLQLCKTREPEGKRASRCNRKWPRILDKLHEHVYIMCALHCHRKCQNRECIQHTLRDREVTANRNYNKAWNLQRLIFSWFWIVGFFSFDNTLCCLNDNDSSFAHQLSSLLHHLVPYALLEWNNSSAASHQKSTLYLSDNKEGTVQQVYSPHTLWADL